MLLLKKCKQGVLFLAVAGFTLAGISVFLEKTPALAEPPAGSFQDKADAHIKAYYFHGNFRCNNCRTIEQYSREAIETYFDEQLQQGKLTFQTVNIDKPENRHFIQDYQLVTRSLVIAEYKNGMQVKWKNLEKVWQHLSNEDAFLNYVKTEIEQYLQEL